MLKKFTLLTLIVVGFFTLVLPLTAQAESVSESIRASDVAIGGFTTSPGDGGAGCRVNSPPNGCGGI